MQSALPAKILYCIVCASTCTQVKLNKAHLLSVGPTKMRQRLQSSIVTIAQASRMYRSQSCALVFSLLSVSLLHSTVLLSSLIAYAARRCSRRCSLRGSSNQCGC